MAGELKRLGERMKDLDAELKTTTKAIDKATPELDALSATIAARATEIATARAKIDAVADTVFGSFCAANGLSTIRDYEVRGIDATRCTCPDGAATRSLHTVSPPRVLQVAVIERGEADAKAKRLLTDSLTKLTMKLEYTRG